MLEDPDSVRDLEARRAALENERIIAIVNRRWKAPETLKSRAQRASATLARVRPTLTHAAWRWRQNTIADAFGAWAFATCGRRHWLRSVIGDPESCDNDIFNLK